MFLTASNGARRSPHAPLATVPSWPEVPIDVGCGTGTLACRLALAGVEVIGVDPAEASFEVARAKHGADGVTWIHGDSTSLPTGLPPIGLAVMTGNVAQVFVTDDEWSAALDGIVAALSNDGQLVFETRDLAKRGWKAWDTGGTATVAATVCGDVETWTTLLDMTEPLVTFRHHYRFVRTDDVLESDSTLWFRTLGEIHVRSQPRGSSSSGVKSSGV